MMPRPSSRLRRPNLEVQNDCSRWTQALEIVEGVDSQAQAKPGGAGEALEADVVRADFNAHAVDLVAIVVVAALAFDPVIAGACEYHAALTGAEADVAGHAIFPVDVAEARSEEHTSELQS